MRPRLRITSTLYVATLALAACTPDAGRPDLPAQAFLRVLSAEDARPAGGTDLRTLLDATGSPAASIRAAAVRALGRLEQPERVDDILPLLGDSEGQVRAEAANALAQAIHRTQGDGVLESLLGGIGQEEDPMVLGAIARSLGRLSLQSDGRAAVDRALVTVSQVDHSEAPGAAQLAVALGMESFARSGPISDLMADRLRRLARTRPAPGQPAADVDRIRSVATAALGAAGRMTASDVETALRDPLPAVRRLATASLRSLDEQARWDFIDRALEDPEGPVRLEAVRALGSGGGAAVCERLLGAVADQDVKVRVTAMQALAAPCPNRTAQLSALGRVASGPDARTALAWHSGSQALVSLASLDRASASALLPTFSGHISPFARVYAAQAAGLLGDGTTLHALADDPVPNVRTAAVQALGALEGRGADPTLLSSLERANDPQLLLTLAGLLAGTELRDQATTTALDALDRISEARWHTLRDARMALLDLVETTGGEAWLSSVEPYLRDFDAEVAHRAAALLESWTGRPYLGAPRPMERLPLPTVEQLRAMERSTLVLHMARGGAIEIRLLPFQAPTNALRLYRQAQDGRLDGLTFHRVASNFVIQGGSPGANEYAGHGTYARDEVGLPVQWEGTVGLSTRGRDTGDGQIYVNLVDNLRLDHDYTVLGVVTGGMDVAHSVLEGDVIERATTLANAAVDSGG